jgi:hypothetical protein
MIYYSLILLFLSLQSLYAVPKLQIEQFNKIDTLYQGYYHYKIKLHNIGNDLLKISSISTSCGCSISYKDSLEILSNQFDYLELGIDLKHSNGFKDIMVIVESNDSLVPIQNVILNFFIYNDLKFSPKQLPSFSRINIGDEITLKIQIKNSGTDLITIFNPYLADIDVGEIISVLPDLRMIKSNDNIELVIKMRILKKEQIITKLIIPTSRRENINHEYLLVIN